VTTSIGRISLQTLDHTDVVTVNLCNVAPLLAQLRTSATAKSKEEAVQPHRFFLVELEGIEPSTPCLQMWRPG